ncbi:MAG: hypothetical protein ACRYFS_20050 [Janthinobacterium lividum]
MIHDMKELLASLRYVSGWADTLEGLRRHSEETGAALLPTTSAGPLAEIRRVITEAQEFVDRSASDSSKEAESDYYITISEEKQKVA